MERLLGGVALVVWAVAGAAIWALYGALVAVVVFTWLVPPATFILLFLTGGGSRAAMSSVPDTSVQEAPGTVTSTASHWPMQQSSSRHGHSLQRPYQPFTTVR